jgi:hypothetical protein
MATLAKKDSLLDKYLAQRKELGMMDLYEITQDTIKHGGKIKLLLNDTTNSSVTLTTLEEAKKFFEQYWM